MKIHELQETVRFWRRKCDERMKKWDAKDRTRLPRNFLKELLSPTHRTVAAVERDLPLGWIDRPTWKMVEQGQITLSVARHVGRFVRQNELEDILVNANPSCCLATVARNRAYTAHEFGGALSDLRDCLLQAWSEGDPPFQEAADRLIEEHLARIRGLHEDLALRETRLAVFEGLANTTFRATESQENLLEKDRERVVDLLEALDGVSARSALTRKAGG